MIGEQTAQAGITGIEQPRMCTTVGSDYTSRKGIVGKFAET